MALTRRQLMQRLGIAGIGAAGASAFTTRGGVLLPSGVAAQDTPVDGGTLEVGFTGDISILDPFASPLNNWVAVRNSVYETLVWADPSDNMAIRPLLAESWEWSEDFLTLTMKLQPGVTFHDGAEFTSADVRFSVERVLDPEVASYLAGVFGALDSVEDIDPLTIRFNLNRPSRPLLTGLAQVHIVSASHASDYTEQVIGTGPFKWVTWEPNTTIQVVKNENYWMDGLPHLDGITWRIIPNVETMNVTLQTGGIHWQPLPDLKDVERLQADENLNVTVTPPLERGYWIYNNMRKPPLDNQTVRQALSYAMDREAVVAAAFAGQGVANCAYLAPDHPQHNPAVRDKYTYNLDKTKELLAEAGYSDPSTLELKMLVYAHVPGYVLEAQILQASLAEIGVNLELEQVDIPTAVERRQSGDWNLHTDGLGRVSGDPHLEILRGVVMMPGPANYCGLEPGMYPEYDELLIRAEATFDPEEMVEVYGEFQEMLATINPTLMVGHHAQVEVTRKEVGGYQLHPWFLHNFRPLWLNNA